MSPRPIVKLPRSRWQEFRRDTIKATSLALLSHVAAHDGDGRTVGLTYRHICEIVRHLHPEFEGAERTLHWFAAKAVEGLNPLFRAELPQNRPHSLRR